MLLTLQMVTIPVTRTCQRCCLSGVSTQVRLAATERLLDRVLRVDHAGEFGAVRIYEGQLAVLGKSSVGSIIQDMMAQEKHHLKTFEELIPKQRARPTALLPFWHVAGFALGAGSALLGKEGAMACTVAVETVIGEHYDNQIRALLADGRNGSTEHKDLIETLQKFRDEELEHLDAGLEHDAEKAPFYNGLSDFIKFGCRTAVWCSERI